MTPLYLVCAVLWLLPVLVASGRCIRIRTAISIAIITLVLSWTIVGWVVALVWALEAPRAD